MKVGLIFRSKDRNEFSIEALFESLKKYINVYYPTEEIYLPLGRYNKISLLKKNVMFAKSIDVDIYHITGEVNFIASVLPARKTIITVHDFVDLEKKRGIIRLIRWIFWYYIPFRRVRFLACISQKTMNETIERFPFTKHKVVYIPNPVDDSYVNVNRIFNNKKPLILVIGTRDNKNIERIIEAVSGINCSLHIIGILSEKQKILLEKSGVEYKNSFRISDDDVRQAYIDSDILCFPSLYEGFGRPIIEANAIGRPVLTSNISPLSDVAADAALLVNPYDVNEIREGILKIIDNPELRKKLVANGLINARRYKAEYVASQYVKLYKQIEESL